MERSSVLSTKSFVSSPQCGHGNGSIFVNKLKKLAVINFDRFAAMLAIAFSFRGWDEKFCFKSAIRALHQTVFFHKRAGIKFDCPAAMLTGTIHEPACFCGRNEKERFTFAMRASNRLPSSLNWECNKPPAMLAITRGIHATIKDPIRLLCQLFLPLSFSQRHILKRRQPSAGVKDACPLARGVAFHERWRNATNPSRWCRH